jgi:hypothetical protein
LSNNKAYSRLQLAAALTSALEPSPLLRLPPGPRFRILSKVDTAESDSESLSRLDCCTKTLGPTVWTCLVALRTRGFLRFCNTAERVGRISV